MQRRPGHQPLRYPIITDMWVTQGSVSFKAFTPYRMRRRFTGNVRGLFHTENVSEVILQLVSDVFILSAQLMEVLFKLFTIQITGATKYNNFINNNYVINYNEVLWSCREISFSRLTNVTSPGFECFLQYIMIIISVKISSVRVVCCCISCRSEL